MAETERHVRLFRDGGNQVLRVPREFELEGDAAIVPKVGKGLTIEPVHTPGPLAFLASLDPLEVAFLDVDEDLAPVADVELQSMSLRYLLDTNITSDCA